MRIAALVLTTLGVIVGLAQVAPAGAAELYTVARHDTLYSIARHFRISVAALAGANNLVNAAQIRVGQVLVIPSLGALVPATAFASGPPAGRSTATADPFPPRYAAGNEPTASHEYVVHAGDTLYHIAKTYGLTVSALQDANRLGDTITLRVGEALIIPNAPVRPAMPSLDAQAPQFDPAPPPPAATPSADAPATLGTPGLGTGVPTAVRGSLQSSLVARLVTTTALQYLGTPYAWGGTTRAGVDCSGLVYAVYSPYVPDLPRVSYDQWDAGVPVAMTALAPGDLVFFDTDGTGASHVGIYIGDGRFVHPSGSAGRVVIDDLNEPYFLSHYLGARRVL